MHKANVRVSMAVIDGRLKKNLESPRRQTLGHTHEGVSGLGLLRWEGPFSLWVAPFIGLGSWIGQKRRQ